MQIYKKDCEGVRLMERVLLPALNFDLSADVPHSYVVLAAGHKPVFDKAWKMANAL